MQKLVTEVRRFRSEQGLADRQKVPARLTGVDGADLNSQAGAVTSLAWLTAPAADFRPSVSLEVRLGPNTDRTVVVELDTSGTIDVAAERRRLEKDLAAAQKELASTAAKLANADFLVKAPQDVVGKIRDRQRVAQGDTDRINARLAGLQ
jgi:valyl-tRNA synthetase